MKFYLSVALVTILFAGAANAQHSSERVTIGIKGGLSLFNIHNDIGATYDAKPAFNVGLLGHVHLVPHLALQPEIVYSGQGAKYSTDGVNTNLNLNYINVPVLLQYMFDNGFRLEAGPQVGFLVNAKSKTDNVLRTDIKDRLKSADLGVVGGISYVHPSTGFGADLRYNLGLSNINDNSTVKSTNRGGQLGIFYLIGHKH